MSEHKDLQKKYDQYCQYENLPKLLKRFSFDEKMRMAFISSCQSLLYFQDKNKLKGRPLPWCVETFTMLAMEATEYAYDSFDGKNIQCFSKMHDAIFASQGILKQSCGRFSFGDIFSVATSLIQFQIQKYPWLEQYRYWKLFNDNTDPVHLKDVFVGFFGTFHDDFIVLANFLKSLFLAQKHQHFQPLPQGIMQYLLGEKYPVVAKQLSIARNEYVALQQEYTKGSTDPYKYVYSLRPSYRYAFVEYEGLLFCPLPHLLDYNVTTSLMYRLTDNDNTLRKDIGKHILEKYLFHVVDNSDQFDEVFPEQKYQKNGSECWSPDVLARSGKKIVFLDSKSSVPSIGLRLFDADAYESNISIVAENIVKLYKHIQSFPAYNPFSGSVSDDLNDYWGIVVVQEGCIMNPKYYYEKAIQDLGFDDGDTASAWLRSHIIVTELYEIEFCAFYGCSMIEGVVKGFHWEKLDSNFDNSPKSTYYSEVQAFIDDILNNRVADLIREISDKGLFQQ